MRRISLFNQVLLVVASVAGVAAVVSALVVGNETSAPALIAAALLTAATASVVALAVLSTRFRSLETLVEEMEKVDLARSGGNLPDAIDGTAESEEVERLEISFLRMMRRLEAERLRSSSAALTAQERERARLARDLHDEVNQSLTGLLLRLEALREDAPPELAEQIDSIRSVASQAMDELLALARQLRPTALDDLGLEAALRGLVEKASESDIAASIEIIGKAGSADLPADLQLVVYRVAQEALANATRHSEAGTVEVYLTVAADGETDLSVTDDGRGFAFADAERGLGLEGMRERALLVGGSLDIRSRPGEGTVVWLHVPSRADPDGPRGL